MSTVEEMVCQELVERVTEYLDSGLDDVDRTRFDQHIADCPFCAEVLEQFRAVIQLTGHLRSDDVAAIDAAQRSELLRAFRTWYADRQGASGPGA